jgi:hypothetical protein
MRLYYFIVGFFKSRRIPVQSLTLEDEIPSDVRLLITTEKEEPQVKKRYGTISRKILRIFGVQGEDQDHINNQLIRNLALLLVGKWDEVILGVDPGVRFGLAVSINGQVIESKEIVGSEPAASLAYQMIQPYLSDRIKVRIGNGILLFVRMFLRALISNPFFHLEVELVDEKKSSTLGRLAQGRSTHSDQAAARIIAHTPGKKIDPVLWTPTIQEHDIKQLQQMSRSITQGKYKLPHDLAKEVALEKYSLAQALDVMIEREEQKETAPNK